MQPREKNHEVKISAKQWGAVREDKVVARVHGVFTLPMGMEREDRCE